MRTKTSRFNWLSIVAAYLAPEKVKALLWPLAFHSNTAGECHPSVPTLARETGCSASTARRRLHKLAAMGLLEIVPRHVPFHAGGKTLYLNLYRLKLPAETTGRPSRVLQGHPDKMTFQKAETTFQNKGDDLPKRGDDLAELCKPNPIRSPLCKPIPKAAGKKPADLPVDKAPSEKKRRIDYETAKLPEINDYTDIHGCPDPILAAMGITGERSKQGWGHWLKVLNQARKEHGVERAERLFQDCLAELFGELKQGEANKPGACLNVKLKKVFG